MTIDLDPFLSAVPAVVIDRLRGAHSVLAVSHENPDADTVGATLAVCRLVERGGAIATAVFADPVPPLYDFLTDVGRARTDPDPEIDYDLLVVSDCGSLDRIGAVRGRHPELFERLPRVVIDHHASNDAAGPTDWIEPHSAAGIAPLEAWRLRPSGPPRWYASVIHVSLWMLLRGFRAMNGFCGARVCFSWCGTAAAPS